MYENNPAGNEMKLENFLDKNMMQSLMDQFYKVTHLPMSIIDLEGNIIVGVGWQDICTNFHRANPKSSARCLESDLELTKGIPEGEYRLYKCKSNMWDAATPLIIENQHMGNIFMGQFFFDDETPDEDMFRRQARYYGFDEDAYIEAFRRVPVFSREHIHRTMVFFAAFADLIASLSYNRTTLSTALAERDRLIGSMQAIQATLQSYIGNAPVAVVVVDGEGQFVDVNPMASTMAGYSREELLSMVFTELIPPESQSAIMKSFRHLITNGSLYDEGPFVGKNGKSGYWSVNSVRVSPDRYLTFVQDITERKTMEKALQESEEKMDLFLNATTELVFLKDAYLKYVWVNDAYIEFLGRTREETLGKTDFELLPAHLAEQCSKSDETILASGEPATLDETADGLIFESRKFPVRFSDGSIGVGAFIRDVTDLWKTREQLRNTVKSTIEVLAQTVERRDPYTAGHQRRVADLAAAIAVEMGLPDSTVDAVSMAGYIHDIGKISIPSEILSKPGKLSEVEMQIIRKHPEHGSEILCEVESPWALADIVVQHHERIDGSGYPGGLMGEEIMLEARIMAVADVVEAMASHRPYRPTLGIDKALDEIASNSGVLYDPRAADACLRIFKEKGYELAE